MIVTENTSKKNTSKVINEAYGVTPMSPSMIKIMKSVFQKAASDPTKFFHILGVAYEDAVFDDDGELKNAKLNDEFTDYLDKFEQGLRAMESGYY